MAEEWYLIKPPHSQLSGYEDDALNDFAQDGFSEILDSGISTEVELCNFDLSVRKTVRAVVQKNVQDTKLKSLVRELYVPIGTCVAGMYVMYKDRYWLIYNLVDDNGMYEKAIMIICNYKVTWLNDDGHVVQRWANIASASQYNNGEINTRFYDLRSDQLMIMLSDDEESLMLRTGDRFIIDRRCEIYEKEFDDSVIKDTSKPVITYVLSRSDSVLYDYKGGGHNEFMVKQDEQRENDGYYFIDGHGYWICKDPGTQPQSDKNLLLSSRIDCDSTDIYNGIAPGAFVARFFDDQGVEVDLTPEWVIACDFAESLIINRERNEISIFADNAKLINKSFELSMSAPGYAPVSKTIFIRAFI